MPLNGYTGQPDYQATMPVYASRVLAGSQLGATTPQYQISPEAQYLLHQPQEAVVASGSPYMYSNAAANSNAVASNTFRLHQNDVTFSL